MKLHYVKPLADVTAEDEPALAAFAADASQKTGEPWIVLLPGTAVGYLDPERGPVEVANAPSLVQASALHRERVLHLVVVALLALLAGTIVGSLS